MVPLPHLLPPSFMTGEGLWVAFGIHWKSASYRPSLPPPPPRWGGGECSGWMHCLRIWVFLKRLLFFLPRAFTPEFFLDSLHDEACCSCLRCNTICSCHSEIAVPHLLTC
eukprot:jgi/Botrbrau1/9090/Bobra.178_2s0021.1